MIGTIQKREDFKDVGMILCHYGVVRGSSRDGRPVNRLRVEVNRDMVKKIVREQKKRPGICEILVETREGELMVGDDLMAIVVAGDIRDNIIPVLSDTLNAIKTQAIKKEEAFLT
ncbi:MAG: molybdenum cofactor biosynthesis protein MoaE [Thermodesulfobacteriota bacterium]|nr:molybdenum cofactor biosynthesis protein MoaE [Thermodesulfobacteriota bacterium]